MRFLAFLAFSLVLSFLLVISAQNEQCGRQDGYRHCPDNYCCSKDGYCGITSAYCCEGCQSQCHDVPCLINETTFNEMFPKQNSSECPSKGFYTYEAFLKAAISFPAFASCGDNKTREREIAAFLAQTAIETAGPQSLDPFHLWGYCYLKETNPPSNYCDPHYRCPKEYYGRGPIQLKWNKNYLRCGAVIGEDLLNNPDLLITDAVISFKSALWFWITSQCDTAPSCHEVITNEWTPTRKEEESKGWHPGFGLITNIINGTNECGNGPNLLGLIRAECFAVYSNRLGTTTGQNLTCFEQQPICPESLAKTM